MSAAPSSWRLISAEEGEMIRRLAAEGMGSHRIAAALPIPRQPKSIAKWARRNGIVLADNRREMRDFAPRKAVVMTEERQALARSYAAQSWTLIQVAKALAIHRDTLNAWARREGVAFVRPRARTRVVMSEAMARRTLAQLGRDGADPAMLRGARNALLWRLTSRRERYPEKAVHLLLAKLEAA